MKPILQTQTVNDDDPEYIELNVSSNLYTEPDKNNKQKLIKTNIITKLSVYLSDIKAHEEIFNSKGKLLTRVCKIHHSLLGPLIVMKSYKQVSDIKHKHHIGPTVKKIGF